MASSKFSSGASALFDWLRERFSRSRKEALPGEDKAHRRGFIISMCVLIALVLWFTLSIGETYTILVEMETQVVNVPQDMALVVLPPATVQVQVHGEGTALFRLRFNPPLLSIDATQDQINVSTLVNPPPGVVAENVIPPVLDLRKEHRISRKIPIRSRAVIEPAESHDFFKAPSLTPDSIVVSGARSIINALDYWPTQSFQRANLKDSLTVRILLADTLVALVAKSHTETILSAVAQQFTEETRLLKVEVTEFPTTLRGVELDPSTVLVKYRVPVSQYEAAQAAPDFYATVSYNRIRADTTGLVRPEIHLPTKLSLRNVVWTPTSLRYYVSLIE